MKVWTSILKAMTDLNIKQNILEYAKSYNNLYLICSKSKDFNVVGEYQPEEILVKYTWVLRLLNNELGMLGFTHHGLITKDGGTEIINYDGEGYDSKNASVCKTDLNKFVQDNQDNIFFVMNVENDHKNSPDEIEKILEQRAGEKSYCLLTNNCEILVRDILIKRDYKNKYQHQAENIIKNKSINVLDIHKLSCYRYDKQNNKLYKLNMFN